MYEVKIKNEVNGREFGARFETKEEKDAWVQEHTEKESWGKVGEFRVFEKNLNLSKTYRNEQKLESIKKESPSVEEVIETLLDFGVNSQEFKALQDKRKAAKDKHVLE